MSTQNTLHPTPADLRESVRDFRNPASTDEERRAIVEWWATLGVPNQFAAMLRAAEIERRES